MAQDVLIAPNHKGFPPWAVGSTVREHCGRMSLLDGGFVTPVLLLNDGTLRRNLRMMQQFCAAGELSLAPHAKTTMSPEIIAQLLAHDVWAVTVASSTQAVAVRAMGVDRILIANEFVDPQGIQWLAAELDRDQDFTGYCYVDSMEGVSALEDVLALRHQGRKVPVLIEFGLVGGRAGVRTIDDAVRLVDVVSESQNLELLGVGGFEGVVTGESDSQRLDLVANYLCSLRAVVDRVYDRDRDNGEFIVTVGGSSFFEFIREEFSAQWRNGRPIRVVLRSGCYVTHDSGVYQSHRRLMRQRCDPVEFTAALELWARVISRPEPELAILDFGRRDVGTDAGLPVLRWIVRAHSKAIEPAPPGVVVDLNDQHAFVQLSGVSQQARHETFVVGDMVGLGISHPCTTLDKWRLIPTVDDHRVLRGSIQTWF